MYLCVYVCSLQGANIEIQDIKIECTYNNRTRKYLNNTRTILKEITFSFLV